MGIVAFSKPSRSVSKVFIHCSDSDVKSHDNIETIRYWHVQENGWHEIGYHIIVTKDGVAHFGRNLEEIPASQYPYNTGTIAICLTGRANFTESQFSTLRRLCASLDKAYKGGLTFHGHCEVSEKTCPNFDYRAVLNLDGSGKLRKDRETGKGGNLGEKSPTDLSEARNKAQKDMQEAQRKYEKHFRMRRGTEMSKSV